MKSKSLIICHIKNCDYPLWRRWLDKHYNFFDEVIIYWSDHFRHMYYDKFIEDSLKHIPNIKFLPFQPYEYGVADWRNVATNRMLDVAKGEWIISIEQDFFCRDWNRLLGAITEASKTYDFLGYKGYQGQTGYQDYLTGNYVHPSFFFMKRETLEKTSKDFTAETSKGCDHFGLITQDAERMRIPIWYTQDNGFLEEEAFHLGGVNQNYLEGLKPEYVFHRPDWFYIYNYWCRKADVPQSPLFTKISLEVEERLKKMFPDIDPQADNRSIFFK